MAIALTRLAPDNTAALSSSEHVADRHAIPRTELCAHRDSKLGTIGVPVTSNIACTDEHCNVYLTAAFTLTDAEAL